MDNFKNICGQDLAIEILKSAISKEHISHAYLFSGPEGVGRKKTAKIFIEAILDNNQEKESTKRKINSNNQGCWDYQLDCFHQRFPKSVFVSQYEIRIGHKTL